MADIGATLREARLRARIDISEVEVDTKIRAKYLRALEDEDFDRLPGPTFVRSFLRTYAEYLGLDARALVDEYKRRWERPSEIDLMPMAPLGSRDRGGGDRRRMRPPGPPRGGILVGLALVVILGVLLVLGLTGDDADDGDAQTPVATTPTQTQTTRTTPRRARPRPAARRPSNRVRLQLEPTGDVWVCLENDDGEAVVAGEVLTPDSDVRAYTSRRFRMTFGNGNLRMRVNGRTLSVPSRAEPVAFEVTPSGRRELDVAEGPGCT